MSSLAKNADTLFERTFAEAMNLHMQYPNIVLSDVCQTMTLTAHNILKIKILYYTLLYIRRKPCS